MVVHLSVFFSMFLFISFCTVSLMFLFRLLFIYLGSYLSVLLLHSRFSRFAASHLLSYPVSSLFLFSHSFSNYAPLWGSKIRCVPLSSVAYSFQVFLEAAMSSYHLCPTIIYFTVFSSDPVGLAGFYVSNVIC